MRGKSAQGSRVTVQIEQYFLYSAAQLTSCSSPTATASRLTSSMLPHVSLGASQVGNLRRHHREATAAGILALRAAGANQMLRPASTTPRSSGRRNRSWHAHFKHAATRQPRRKPSLKPASTPPRSYGRRHLGTTSRRRKPIAETCVDNTAKLRPQASVLAR